MLKLLWYNSLIFFANKLVRYLFNGMNTSDQFAHAKIVTFGTLIDTFAFIMLMWIFRPRKRWPEFFLIRLGEQAGQQNGNLINPNQI
jgi:hypothetical protein